jgi:hypothetical protein
MTTVHAMLLMSFRQAGVAAGAMGMADWMTGAAVQTGSLGDSLDRDLG